MADWLSKAKEIQAKIKSYRDQKEGWKVVKTSADVTVWEKPSPDWSGTLYKVEGELKASPEAVFSYIDPSPNSSRSQWDKAIKELQLIEKVSENVSAMRTITHSAFGGLIASRDFTDLIVNEKTDEYISTNAQNIEHPGCAPSSDFVRGKNYPCAIICFRVPGEPNKTRMTSYIQTDLGGMLPKSLVENALPSNQINFFTALGNTLKDAGQWNGTKADDIRSG